VNKRLAYFVHVRIVYCFIHCLEYSGVRKKTNIWLGVREVEKFEKHWSSGCYFGEGQVWCLRIIGCMYWEQRRTTVSLLPATLRLFLSSTATGEFKIFLLFVLLLLPHTKPIACFHTSVWPSFYQVPSYTIDQGWLTYGACAEFAHWMIWSGALHTCNRNKVRW